MTHHVAGKMLERCLTPPQKKIDDTALFHPAICLLDALSAHGLIRLESDRFLSSSAPVPGQIIAATHAYFQSVEAAQAAMSAAGPVLMANVSNYTNLAPQIHFSAVTVHD